MRRLLATLFILVSFHIPAGAKSLSQPPIDIVFDIDWTTFYSIDSANPNQIDGNVVIVEGKSYRATDHLGETLQALLKHPEVRISFFSGGDRSRNETLLKSVHLPDGRSAYDIAYRVFSKDQLTLVSSDGTLKFSERYKKSFDGLLESASADRTILIDDQTNFALKPWRAVSSLGLFNFQKSFDPALSNKDYFPSTADAWKAERDKALMWKSLLEEGLELSKVSSKPFAEITSELWAAKSGKALCKNVFIF